MPQFSVFILFLAFSLAGGNLQQQLQPHYTTVIANQNIDLAPSIMSTARQSCENWALAAGLETILQRQDVALDQRFWVLRLSGGEVCTPAMPSIDKLAQVVNKQFTLEDGRHVRLELSFVSRTPIDTAALVTGLKQQQLSLFLWHGHAYYMSGVTYDERITDGIHEYAIKELRLENTYNKQPKITFQRGRDSADEIEGIFTVSVIPQ